MTYIAKAFSSNDFETPLAVHGQIPPGVPQMKELSKTIKYEFQEAPNGAKVRISTNSPEALTATGLSYKKYLPLSKPRSLLMPSDSTFISLRQV